MKRVCTGLLLAVLLLCGCGNSGAESLATDAWETTATTEGTLSVTNPQWEQIPVEVSPEAQLLALADDQEEAEQIAELYGIELVNFSYGVATYYTEDNPQEVIRRGLKNGWPELSLNHVLELF